MQPETAQLGTRTSKYFSIGALVGSVFAGLWAGGGVFLVYRELFDGYAGAEITTFPIVVAGALFWSLLAALIAALPVTIAVAGVIFLLARLAHARPLPKVAGFGLLGAAAGTVLTSLLIVADIMAGRSMTQEFDLPLIIAGIGGGTLAGVIYRALLAYRSRSIGSGGTQAGTTI